MKQYAKLVAFILGAVANIAAVGLVHGDARLWCVAVLAAATGAGIYHAPSPT